MAKKILFKQKAKPDTKLADKKAKGTSLRSFAKPPKAFTRALATEIVRNLTTIGKITVRPIVYTAGTIRKHRMQRTYLVEHPIVIDSSVLIDGRILPIVNSGFLIGTLIIPKYILREVQHIADSQDAVRRAKGRRGLEVMHRLKSQKTNKAVHIRIVSEDGGKNEDKEVDQKLISLAKRYNAKLLTVDFNLAQIARAEKITVLNINDLANALKIAIVPGEEMVIKITHEGREERQGVGYLTDGTMIIVDGARSMVNKDVAIIVTKVHQTPAGQIFFARMR